MKRLEPLNDYERTVLANVERFGWHCTTVGPRNGEDSPRFTYTVGLFQSYGQPEFIIFGLAAKTAHGILSVLANAAKVGAMFPLDKPCGELVEGYECAFVQVPRMRYNDFVFSALWFYAERDFPLYQVVWPDEKGLYPWHKGVTKDPDHHQPVLALGE
jgi:hypothetical protein